MTPHWFEIKRSEQDKPVHAFATAEVKEGSVALCDYLVKPEVTVTEQRAAPQWQLCNQCIAITLER